MFTPHRFYDTLNTASRLPSHVLRTFFFLAALAGTGGTLALLIHGPFAHAAPVAHVSPGSQQLPAQPEAIVTLPIVTVRASDASPHHADEAQTHTAAHLRAAANLRMARLAHPASGGDFGMPYYSFARPMRVANKE